MTNALNSVATQSFTVYPNPAVSILSITVLEEGEVNILNLSGQCIKKDIVHSGLNLINVNELPRGLYLVQIAGYKTEKIILQ